MGRFLLLSMLAMVAAIGGACSESSEGNAWQGKAGSDGGIDDGAADQKTDGIVGDGAVDGEAGVGPCVPKTCAQLGATCGSAPDGCGGKVECGKCPAGQLCGGDGVNKCGHNPCSPKTCAQVGTSCGFASDQCGTAIDCGGCMPPAVCGASGKLNECGCVPKTCAQLGASCGSVPDGCGGKVDCGGCPTGQVCGGAGANKCGTGTCVAKSCAQVGASCGVASDGCSNVLQCGTCTAPQMCGGAGTANQCGCTPKTCSQLQASCGKVNTGCGEVDCGTCGTGDTCGGTGTANQCGCTCTLPHAITSCSAGDCTLTACNAGWGDCDGDSTNGCEADLNTSFGNCGTCGLTCTFANGTGECAQGKCEISSCYADYANCDNDTANGCEASLKTDPKNCASCGNVCPGGTGTPVCQVGACSLSDCNVGLGDCDNNKANGCETDITSSVSNCGACGNACNLTNATASCVQSACKVASCAQGWGNCDGNDSNGCETNTDIAVSNCGGCGNVCPAPLNANPTCSSGKCDITCHAGYQDCDNQPTSGCEINTDTDIDSCGSCGNKCNTPHAEPTCSKGQCVIASCHSGFGNCNNQAWDGCEANLTTEVGNCGSCGISCAVPNATFGCTTGNCELTGCLGTFRNCDGVRDNGCETDVVNGGNVYHCGACLNECSANHGKPSCVAGGCQIACDPGFANCDGDVGNGCEVDLNNRADHCGGCGQACSNNHGTPTCNSGNCSMSTCETNWDNCDGDARANGCETDLSTTEAHCGQCNHVCSAANGTPDCNGGTCSIACAGGFADCDGNNANGCEINVTVDSSNCGSCGNNCNSPQPANTSGNPCGGGTCVANCNGGWFDIDGAFGDGCECQADGIHDDCGSSVSIGVIGLGGGNTVAASITPSTDVDYWTVAFTGQGSCAYHPVITLNDSSGQLRMDVTTDCGTAVQCSAEGGSSGGVRQVELGYSAGCGYQGIPDPYRYPMTNYSTFYVRVYRGVGGPASCLPYSISVSN